MAVTLEYQTNITVKETLTTNVPDAATNGAIITHSGFNKTSTLTASTTPPVSKHAAFQQALTAGVATIDLTALVGTNGAAVDGTGLKVQAFKFANPSTNANAITVVFGAATGYLLGGTAWKWTLSPGQEIEGYGNSATPTISALLKNIDLAGTASQALNVEIVMG